MIRISTTTDGSDRLGATRPVRHGITLLELMLVLALLVILGAMAYPSLQKPFQMQTLRKSGELVRVELSKARNKAMRTGQIQMFSFEPETGNYQIQPYYTEQDTLEGNYTAVAYGLATGGSTAVNSQSQSATGTTRGEALPEGVVFVNAEVQSDMRSLQLQQDSQATMGAVNQAIDLQVPPVLFYPDGTTSDARVILTNQYQTAYVVITLRSLTGVVHVSDLVSSNEIQTVQ